MNTTKLLQGCVIAFFLAQSVPAQKARSRETTSNSIPMPVLLRLVKAEDERRADNDLRDLLSNPSPAIRERAALAAGRIGKEDSLGELIPLLRQDSHTAVRAMAAFAVGEIESPLGAEALVTTLKNPSEALEVRARAVEALGKIAAALPKEKEAQAHELGAVILKVLQSEASRPKSDELTVLLGLTATLRAKPLNAGATIAGFLNHSNSRIRSDAANTLARLRLKDGNEQLRGLLVTDAEPNVRANAARVLGATEDKASFESLLSKATADTDSRVRVSAIRALAALKDPRANGPLQQRLSLLMKQVNDRPPAEKNELLELTTALSRLLPASSDLDLSWLKALRLLETGTDPEIDIAFARLSPNQFLGSFWSGDDAKKTVQMALLLDWRRGAAIAQGLGQIPTLPDSLKTPDLVKQAEDLLRAMLDYRNSGIHMNTLVAVHSEYAIPDVLRALAAFKPADLGEILRRQLNESDVIVRSTAADLLGDLPPTDENTRALVAAWPRTTGDQLNDAALSILDSLGKQKTPAANDAIKQALDSSDYLVRQKAVAVLKANGTGDFSSRIGTVKSRNTPADYQRALARVGKPVHAVVTTSKGSFTIQLLPNEAPLTVDNFIGLAQRGYFRGITVHRVVANFVIQDGDPRGDGNGGPGYQIRCEINEVPYDRAAVGMALSGKDTGGSQWFVTHAPQPHLDGGYTVFGRVITGMAVVDKIVRGDVINSIVIK
ncbi:MAG TPA: peptidylprolyl isomerase [Pyrinomonadaceae bacterium]|nr:peptidylprolyl isomerase [Pyrinomonadaceae bacterium]